MVDIESEVIKNAYSSMEAQFSCIDMHVLAAENRIAAYLVNTPSVRLLDIFDVKDV